MFTCLTFSGFFLSFIQHLEHHFNHFCPVSWDGVSQDTVSCSRAPFTCVARQQWKRGWQNKAHAWNTSLKDPPCQLPFTVTLATTTQPPLLWLTGGQVNAKAWKAWRSIYLFWKNGQPSRSLHEKMIKYIPAKETGEAEWASSRAEKNHFTGRFWMADRGAVLTCVTSNIKTQAAGTSCWQSSLYMFDLVLLLLNIKGYWLFADFFWDSWTNSHLLKKNDHFHLLLISRTNDGHVKEGSQWAQHQRFQTLWACVILYCYHTSHSFLCWIWFFFRATTPKQMLPNHFTFTFRCSI